jgi:hypothetical protein
VGVGAGYVAPFYFAGGEAVGLPSLVVDLGGFTIVAPTDINDAGYVTGIGRNSDGQLPGFILAPVLEVLEQPMLALLFFGLLSLNATRRKKPSGSGAVAAWRRQEPTTVERLSAHSRARSGPPAGPNQAFAYARCAAASPLPSPLRL